MKYPNDTAIPIRMCICIVILVGNAHEFSMCTRIQRVLSSPSIVGSIIYLYDLVFVNPIVDKGYVVLFRITKFLFVSVVWDFKKTCKYVIFKSRQKILIWH